MFRSAKACAPGGLYLAWSQDGIGWFLSHTIETDVSEACYPSLLGLGSDPLDLDRSFYFYYTTSEIGGIRRWRDAGLSRRLVTIV